MVPRQTWPAAPELPSSIAFEHACRDFAIRLLSLLPTRWIDAEPQVNEGLYSLGNTIPGALAEYLVLDQQALTHDPGYLTDEEAAAISCAGITAWYSLVEKGGLKANQTALIQGTGGVSLSGLQIGSALE